MTTTPTTDPQSPQPFDRHAALADLYALGQKLNAMTATHHAEIESTLARMKQLHAAITHNLTTT